MTTIEGFAGLPADVIEQLKQALDPALLSYKKVGKDDSRRTVPFLEGPVIIDQLNRIFGFGAWSFRVLDVPQRQDVYSVDKATGERRYCGCFYWSRGHLELLATGASHEDVGVSVPRTEEKVESHIEAFLGASTQAMKRCAQHHGAQFGNNLRSDVLPLQKREETGEQEAPQTPRQAAGVRAGEEKPSRQEAAQAPRQDTERTVGQEEPPRQDVVSTPTGDPAIARLQAVAERAAQDMGWPPSQLQDWLRAKAPCPLDQLDNKAWADLVNTLLALRRHNGGKGG